jgi:hypothetical protein
MGSLDERVYQPTGQVLSRVLDGEAVLLDLGGGQYYGLDPVGTEVWRGLEAGATPSELVRRVVAAYDVDPDTARRDIEALLSELLARKLIV